MKVEMMYDSLFVVMPAGTVTAGASDAEAFRARLRELEAENQRLRDLVQEACNEGIWHGWYKRALEALQEGE